MCGISGIIYKKVNNGLEIFESLLSIQHRGQDGGGIYCADSEDLTVGKGLIHNLFTYENLKNMKSQIYLGHTRYKTNDVKNSFQPFTLKNNNLNMSFCHNGNIINADEIQNIVKTSYDIDKESNISDSMVLFNFIFCFLNEELQTNKVITNDVIINLSNKLHEIVNGSFSIIFGIKNFGIVAMKDKRGIRPLAYGRNKNNDYLISSESCSLNNVLDYFDIKELNPGETVIFPFDNEIFSYQYKNVDFTPCLFEYIYFSRLDSILNNISIYTIRYKLGELLGNIINKEKIDVDFIIPTPETSRVYAYGMSNITNIPIQECIIKNRYINRTFIIENKDSISKNVKRKFSIINEIVKDKNVLLIDDSIVRGNTSRNIINLLKEAGVKNVIFGSAAPKITNSNKYGIYIEKKEELISYKNTNETIASIIGAKKIFYNDLQEIKNLINNLNSSISNLEISMFL